DSIGSQPFILSPLYTASIIYDSGETTSTIPFYFHPIMNVVPIIGLGFVTIRLKVIMKTLCELPEIKLVYSLLSEQKKYKIWNTNCILFKYPEYDTISGVISYGKKYICISGGSIHFNSIVQ